GLPTAFKDLQPVAGFPNTRGSPLFREARSPADSVLVERVRAAGALAIALLVGSWMWSRSPDYAVLFANISEKDGGAILQALTQQNVPYRFNEGGGAILVPSDRVHEVRLRLASQGLPRGGHVGFELMDSLKLGVSQFAEQVSYQRALEGELA
ncbi:MAG TPA: amidase family protein, partial [Rhodocyclaceae bacterium]|nr:amidase family protein [Rhodocyclaceae bacterium]